ncbi:MAG: 5'/3'-nucleotidase SurE [Bacteroidales bacterium]|nr:5'/3'-nucleotidase SurE [Bacteroidales bacterium]
MPQKPLIFITNDDGFQARGIRLLEKILQPLGDIVVVAPLVEQSGKSHAITGGKPLRLECLTKRDGFEEYALEGTPVDCVKMAFDKVLDRKPDFLFAGINHGANTSINTIYSGTMGAVTEGCSEGVPSVGFSLCDNDKEASLNECEAVVEMIAKRVVENGLPDGVCLNVNFPVGTIKGVKVGHQAKGYWREDFTSSEKDGERSIFWLGGEYYCTDESPLADWRIVENGYASIVPMQVDFTAYKAMQRIREIFE